MVNKESIQEFVGSKFKSPIVEIIMLKATAMEKAGKAAQELLDVQNNMDGQGSPKQIFTSTPLRH